MFFKKIYYAFLSWLEPLLDSFSSRLCFFCRNNLGALICDDCVKEQLSLKKKVIDYRILDNFFLDHEQVFHPKIFYLINFFKKTSYLIKKAKYTRPHFSKFFAQQLSVFLLENINQILADDVNLAYVEDFPYSSTKLNLFITHSPMYLEKEKTRAFNFAALLAEDLTKNLLANLEKSRNLKVIFQSSRGVYQHDLAKIEFLEDYFIRVKDTKALFNLGQDCRIKEITNAFVINKNIGLVKRDLNVLLIIDDICTTGSTMLELMKLSRIYADFDEQIGFTIYGRNLI